MLKNAAAVPLTLTLSPAGRAYARLEGVNKPEMLPEGPVRSRSGNNREFQQREDSDVQAVLAPLPS